MKANLLVLPLLAACATGRSALEGAPLVDYHQHLVSPAFAPIVQLPQRDGKALLAELDAAGISKAVVLSVGYSFADERKKLEDPDQLTRKENDWTSGQVAASGGRLIGFCSANPLRLAALDELERCLALPGMRGIKLHFGNGGISLRVPAHAARLVQVFALAERLHAPVLVHMRARNGVDFGAEDARLFLNTLVPAAPSIEIVVAHFGGAGPGYPAQTDEVMAVFGAAAESKDPRMQNVYFDVATIVTGETTTEEAALVATRVHQVGTQRVLYGSDLSPPGGSIRSGWEIFRNRVPLTAAEFRTIAGNMTRFARSLPRESQILRVPSKDGTLIAVECAGAGPTLILVHGGIGDRTRWTPMFPLLSSHFTVCAMDRRGHGLSGDSPAYSLQREAEDVASVVDSRRGTVFVLGHSYGGVSALESMFLTNRVSKLILYEPPVQEPVEQDLAVTAKMQQMINEGAREQAAVTFLTEVVHVSPTEVAAMKARPAWLQLVSTIDGQLRQMYALAAYRFDATRMASVQQPTLLLLGENTTSPYMKQSINSLQTSLPNATRVVLQGQQHNAMDTGRDALATAIITFLLGPPSQDVTR